MREREMLKVTICIRENSFVEALINMVCELKITSGSKKLCKNSMVIRHCVEELLAKNSVTRSMEYTAVFNVLGKKYIQTPWLNGAMAAREGTPQGR